MAEEKTVAKGKVRHVGTFDFKDTYRVTYEWLMQEGYEVNETSYREVIGANGMKEVEVIWKAYKSVSDYFKFYIDIKFHPLAMTGVEVEIDGIKQKMNKGDLTIELKGVLIKDAANKWTNNNFSKSLRTMYDKYLIPERIEQHEAKLISEYNALDEFLKSHLALTGKLG